MGKKNTIWTNESESVFQAALQKAGSAKSAVKLPKPTNGLSTTPMNGTYSLNATTLPNSAP